MNNDHNYYVKYLIETGSFSKEQLLQEQAGGCDEFGLISVIGGVLNGEAMSVKMLSVTPNGEWNSEQWFEIWAFIAVQLKDSDLPIAYKQIAQDAFDRVKRLKIEQKKLFVLPD